MAGRNPKYKDPAEMQSDIDAYFRACEGEPFLDEEGNALLDKQGAPVIVNAKPPTVSGLALALGLNSRQSLLNYQGKKMFADTVKRAKLRVEEYCERQLFDRDKRQGAEFNLRFNFRWDEREEKEGEKGGGGVVLLPAVMELPEEEADE